MNRFFQLPVILVTVALLGLNACSKEAGKETAAEGSGDPGADFKSGILDINSTMSGILDNISKPEDVEKSDEAIGRIYDRMFELSKPTLTDTTMRNVMMTIQNDSAVLASNSLIDSKISALKTSNPDASAKLREVLAKHSLRLNQEVNAYMKEHQGDTAGAGTGGGAGDGE